MSALYDFTQWAKEHNWKAELKKTPSEHLNLPHEIIQRYGSLPEDFSNFLKNVESLSNKRKTAWFLCEDDYHKEDSPYSFVWNEAELRSLDNALGDRALMADIKSWWDKHLPVMIMECKSGCQYFAIDCLTGGIVKGCEPNFEETTPVATSFKNLLEKIITGEIPL